MLKTDGWKRRWFIGLMFLHSPPPKPSLLGRHTQNTYILSYRTHPASPNSSTHLTSTNAPSIRLFASTPSASIISSHRVFPPAILLPLFLPSFLPFYLSSFFSLSFFLSSLYAKRKEREKKEKKRRERSIKLSRIQCHEMP